MNDINMKRRIDVKKKSGRFVKAFFTLIAMALLNVGISDIVFAADKILIYDNKEHVYTGDAITLRIDANPIENKGMYPVIIDNRTLVPLREVMESKEIGATVTFVSSTEPIKIVKNGMTIELTINSTSATVNGVTTTLDVPAKLIRDKSVGIDKTMVPVRFVTESLGYKVDWDGYNREVVLTNNERDVFEFTTMVSNVTTFETSNNKLNLPTQLVTQPRMMNVATQTDYKKLADGSSEVSYSEASIKEIVGNAEETRFYIRSNQSMSTIKYSYWDNKVIVDIDGLNMGTFPTAIQMEKGVYVQKVRTSQYRDDPYQGRIVFDLYDNAVPREVIISEDRTQIELVFNEVGLSEVQIGQDQLGDYIKLSGEYKSPSLFRLEGPNRMVIDLKNTVNLLGKKEQNFLNGEELKSVKIGQLTQDTTRIVVETIDHSDFTFSYDNTTDLTTIRLQPSIINYIKVERKTDNQRDSSLVTIPNSFYLPEMLLIESDLAAFKTTITFPELIPTLSSGENVFIGDSNINKIEVTTVNNKSVLTIIGNHIQEYSVVSTENGIVLKGMRPKDIYPNIVVIDIGHGGNDPGASYNGIIEKEVNLKIGNYLKQSISPSSSVKFYFTRESDIYLTLQKRVDIANDLEADFILAIHNNAIDISKDPTKKEVNGLEILTTIDRDKSSREIEVANGLYGFIQQQLPSINFRGVRDYSKLFILRYSNMPAIIVEYAFLTNEIDAQNLKDENILKELGRLTGVYLESIF